jgi:hypothetical protein
MQVNEFQNPENGNDDDDKTGRRLILQSFSTLQILPGLYLYAIKSHVFLPFNLFDILLLNYLYMILNFFETFIIKLTKR